MMPRRILSIPCNLCSAGVQKTVLEKICDQPDFALSLVFDRVVRVCSFCGDTRTLVPMIIHETASGSTLLRSWLNPHSHEILCDSVLGSVWWLATSRNGHAFVQNLVIAAEPGSGGLQTMASEICVHFFDIVRDRFGHKVIQRIIEHLYRKKQVQCSDWRLAVLRLVLANLTWLPDHTFSRRVIGTILKEGGPAEELFFECAEVFQENAGDGFYEFLTTSARRFMPSVVDEVDGEIKEGIEEIDEIKEAMDWTRRQHKRRQIIDALTELPVPAFEFLPDPEDKSISKRSWERQVQKYRAVSRAFVLRDLEKL
jgi:hypothetical protein